MKKFIPIFIFIIGTCFADGPTDQEEEKGNWDEVNDPNLKPGEEPDPFIEYRPMRPPKRTPDQIFNQPSSKGTTPPRSLPQNKIPRGKIESSRVQKNPLPQTSIPKGPIEGAKIPRNPLKGEKFSPNPLPRNPIPRGNSSSAGDEEQQ